MPWIAAHAIGAVLLAWISIVNGFPMVFSDSGGYLRVGTELHYLLDRPVTYGLLIAPFSRLFGLWAIVVLQALLASWLIGQVLFAITRRRSAPMLVAIVATLAGFSSLPWFVGQVMPDLATSLLVLSLYLMLFDPRSGWRAWVMWMLATALVATHLSHIPIAAALIGLAGVLLAFQAGWRSAVLRTLPALSALLVAVLGLCTLNMLAAGSFRPSLQSEKFLVAKLFDSRIGQPELRRLCATENWQLCKALAFVGDPRRTQAGQDYLWANDSPRSALEARDPIRFRSEEGLFARRVLSENPVGTLRVALFGWRDQLVRAQAADGMVVYPPKMEVAKQIHKYFPGQSAAFEGSMQQRDTLQHLALAPDRAIGLLVVLLSPAILWFAIRQRDQRMIALTLFLLSALVINAAVCGILSGPADRYQSRVMWLPLLLGLLALARRFTVAYRADTGPAAG